MLFRDLGVPRSTAASWIRRGPRPVVSTEVLAMDQQELQAEILSLQRRVRFLLAILAAIAHAQKALPLAVALRVLRLSPARFHTWASPARDCPLDDWPSCPHTTPVWPPSSPSASRWAPAQTWRGREGAQRHEGFGDNQGQAGPAHEERGTSGGGMRNVLY